MSDRGAGLGEEPGEQRGQGPDEASDTASDTDPDTDSDTERSRTGRLLDGLTGRGQPRSITIRTMVTGIGLVLLTYAGFWVLRQVTRPITWLLIAAFFAIVLTPPVDFLVRRMHMRRGLAAGTVFLVGLLLIVGMLYAFIRPIVDQASEFADKFPTYVKDARAGKGWVGEMVTRYNIDEWFQKNQARLRSSVSDLGAPALDVARSVFNTLAATLTIAVLTFLMLIEGPEFLRGGLSMLSPPRQRRVRRIARDCARAVTGYVAGNLSISVIAGLFTYVVLLILRVPFREVLALWVGFADLIPLVGATMGAIPTIGVSFLHSVPAGIVSFVAYVLYQQFENHILQVTIMARTVALKPLTVLVSVLIGVELFGLLGALLAIPAAGIIKVLANEFLAPYRHPVVAEGGPAVSNVPGAPPSTVDIAEVAEVAEVAEPATGPMNGPVRNGSAVSPGRTRPGRRGGRSGRGTG